MNSHDDAPPLRLWLYTFLILIACAFGVAALWIAGFDIWALLV
ncbi:MAG TPA: hypothetical protein PKJ85_10390 [Nitrosomonas nitrosa]|nr:hypothetical protein [Nitrosomonas nitrosa]